MHPNPNNTLWPGRWCTINKKYVWQNCHSPNSIPNDCSCRATQLVSEYKSTIELTGLEFEMKE